MPKIAESDAYPAAQNTGLLCQNKETVNTPFVLDTEGFFMPQMVLFYSTECFLCHRVILLCRIWFYFLQPAA